MLFPVGNIVLDELQNDFLNQKRIGLAVLRLDLVHPVVAGNKLFKLHYFLKNALQQSSKGILTFGGAYSNHLVATAFSCRQAGLKCIGLIRGEVPALLTHTLQSCLEYGMELKFLSRMEYDKKEEPAFLNEIKSAYKNYLIIPEGGYHPLGADGAALIMDLISADTSHICCAVGTATTLAGLLNGIKNEQQIIGIPVLKNLYDLQQRISFLTNREFSTQQLNILTEYHFGGYAKKTKELIDSMNLLYKNHQVPTDFVYTGKMMFGVLDSISNNYFKPGSKIVCIHTGGLQGNLSLKPGTLVY